jgi:hypothetical protein
MLVLITTVAGLCLWIVLWALNIKGVDGIAIVLLLVALALGLQQMLTYLPGRRE